MSSDLPPDPYFSNINFNPNFFTTAVQYLTEKIANLKYLRLIGGVLTGNLGIKRTPRTELDINGKAIIDNNLNAIPSVGILGGNGTKLILTAGTPASEPFALGTYSNTMWYGVPTTASHIFYNGNRKQLIIDNSGNVGIGFTDTFSTSTKLYVSANIATPATTYVMRTAAGATDETAGKATLIGLGSESDITYSKCAIGHVKSQSFDRGHIVFLTRSSADTVSCQLTADERMRITSGGTVAIGTNNPGSNKLYISAGLTTANTNIVMRIAAGASDETGGKATLIGLGSDGVSYTKCAIGHIRTASNDRGNIVFLTNNDATTNSCGISDIRLVITPTGNITAATGTTFFAGGTHSYFGSTTTTGMRIGKNDIFTDTTNGGGITIWTQNTGSAISLGFLGGNGTILTINNANATFTQPILVSGASAKIGIGTATTPNNILQVGDGGKLRISNGTTDYTLIGSKDTDDTNNTKIVIGGYQQSGNTGNIKYYCVGATGAHTFYVNTLATFDIDSSDFTIYNSITSVGANYYTDGQYISYSLKNDALGTVRAGYFIDTGRFFNSMVALALSHNSTSYTYWHGHVGTNNTTNPIYINLLVGSNMAIESFVEQTTLKPWLRVYPLVAYSTAVQLRVKFYG
jgi:hypothetical protein